MTDSIVLRRLTTHDLPTVAGWFEDPDTSRYLGGPEWLATMLANAEGSTGADYRGARETSAMSRTRRTHLTCICIPGRTASPKVDT